MLSSKIKEYHSLSNMLCYTTMQNVYVIEINFIVITEIQIQ